MECKTEALKTALNLAIEGYKQIRAALKQANLAIHELAKQSPFVAAQKYLESIDGIGLLNGMVIQTEIQDIRRFRTLDTPCGYAGFLPDISRSDERMVLTGITSRC